MYSAQVLKKQAQKENRQEWGHRQQLFYEKYVLTFSIPCVDEMKHLMQEVVF